MADSSNTTASGGALAGIRVIDLTRVISGPFCTQMLGDHGADVIKIEPPGRGDIVRSQGNIVRGFSWYFAQFNRNKRSLTLNLREQAGQAILYRLLEDADVLVENFRPGVLAKMGLDDATLRQRFPHLVVGRINGFGSTGPYRDRPAYDFIAQAMSGFMGVNGSADGEPMRSAPPMSDMIASQNLAFGISAALVRRERSGQGDIVETALSNGLLGMMSYLAAEYFATGKIPKRTGNDHPMLYPYGLFRASDGEVAIAPSNNIMVERFLAALDMLHLLDDERFACNERRMDNREALRDILNQVISRKTVQAWIDYLNEAGVPCGRVYDLREAFDNPQAQAQEMKLELDQGEYGTVPTTGFPVKMHESTPSVHAPAPQLGEHTQDILTTLGLSGAEIKTLREQDVI